MPNRSRGFRSPRVSRRRLTSWQVGPGNSTGQSVAATSSVLLGDGALAIEDGLTVVRIRGELLLTLLTSSAVAGGFAGAFGIGKTTFEAFGTGGVTAVPTPLDDSDWDGWLYHRFFFLRSAGVIVQADVLKEASALGPVVSALRIEVDTKAMRKVPEGELIFGVLQVIEAGVATMQVDFDSRMLVKLP